MPDVRSFEVQRLPGGLANRTTDNVSRLFGFGVATDIEFSGPGSISGIVTNIGTPGTPVRRKVRLCLARNGRPIRETWSQEGTGLFTFEYLKLGVDYEVRSYDHTGAYDPVTRITQALAG